MIYTSSHLAAQRIKRQLNVQPSEYDSVEFDDNRKAIRVEVVEDYKTEVIWIGSVIAIIIIGFIIGIIL